MISQEIVWILFKNPKCGQFTRIKNAHLYEYETHSTCTPIESITKDIQIGTFLTLIQQYNFPFNWQQHILYIEHKD